MLRPSVGALGGVAWGAYVFPVLCRRGAPAPAFARSIEDSSLPANARLARLADNPFTRLGELLAGVTPRSNEPPILMSVGEPQHPPPALLARIVADGAHLWNRYPPMSGTPEYRAACAGWLPPRYPPPAGTGPRGPPQPAPCRP